MRVEVFVDFDGTVTDLDTHEVLMRHFVGDRHFEAVQSRLIKGEITVRESLDLQLRGVREATFEDAMALLSSRITVDPFFATFVRACARAGIDCSILSSGMKPVIEYFLASLDPSVLRVIACDVDFDAQGWRMRWTDGSSNGINKRAYVERSQGIGRHVCFIGNGITDFDAAVAADECFARKGDLLDELLTRAKIAHGTFSSFDELTVGPDRLLAVVRAEHH